MTVIPLRSEPESGWAAFLSNGFRPMFLACALQALGAMLLWLMQLGGVSLPPPEGWSGIEWHGHEMLFGFVGAVITSYSIHYTKLYDLCRICFISCGARNCAFLMLMAAPVSAMATTRSVWRVV